MRVAILFILISVSFALTANADIYKWIDENGVTHYSNTPPPADVQGYIERLKEVSGTPVNHGNPGIDRVIQSYKQDNLQGETGSAGEPPADNSAQGSNTEMTDYYRHQADRYQMQIDDYEDRLESIKRESYTDSRRHRARIERWEKYIREASFERDVYLEKYRKATQGQ